MSSELDSLITLGHDIISTKYYSIATTVVIFYDYFLTLEDEIKYAWSRKRSWTFWLFVVNRYFPMSYKILLIPLSDTSSYDKKTCNRITFYTVMALVICTLLAQIVLTTRVYAVTMKNVPIAAGLAAITACQFVFGIFAVVLVSKKGAESLPPIPLDAYRLCVFDEHRSLEIIYTSISLLYDFLAFSLIMFVSLWSRRMTAGLKVETILGTVAEDATRYFLIIFTSHFVLEMTLIFGRPSIQLLPASGIVVYLPVMVSRIMLSLRKAAGPQQGGRSLGEPSMGTLNSIRFFRPEAGTNSGGDDIQLDSHAAP